MKKRARARMRCAAMIGTGGINVLAEEASDGYVGVVCYPSREQ